MVKNFTVKEATPNQHANGNLGANIQHVEKVKIVACDGKNEGKSQCNSPFVLVQHFCHSRCHLVSNLDQSTSCVLLFFLVCLNKLIDSVKDSTSRLDQRQRLVHLAPMERIKCFIWIALLSFPREKKYFYAEIEQRISSRQTSCIQWKKD